MATTVQKWGNSLGVRIPKSIADQVGLKDGTEVEFDTTGGVLTLRPKRSRRHTLASLLARTKGPNPHGEIDRSGPVGREVI